MNKSHATGWTSASPTPAQIKEFFAQIESGRITKRKLQGFLRTNTAMKNEGVARDIMGDDIIFPDEIAEVRGFSYTEAQLKQLSDIMPTADVMQWCKENGFALMPTPPEAMFLLDIRALKADHFYSKTGGWYGEDKQKFARDDKTSFGWIMIKKTPVDKSTSKDWDEQNKLLSDVERVPNVAETVWFITTFYEVRGVRLFERIYVRTSSLDSDGGRVYVGNFGAKGLYVAYNWDSSRHGHLGLASARK